MNCRLKDFKVTTFLLAMGLTAMLGFTMQGCSSGGGSGGGSTGTVQLSGTISSATGTGYTHSKSLMAAGLNNPVIDTVLAIPMDRGSLSSWGMTNSKTAVIAADGSFSLGLAKTADWLLVLINSAATGTRRFVGSVAMDTGTADSLLNLPATIAAISSMPLGTISRSADPTSSDALSTRMVTTADFSNFSQAQLTAMAKTDDIFRNAMNIVNNYEQFGNSAGTWYQLRPDFHWDGDLASLATTSALESAPSLTYSGMNFQLDQNADSVLMTSICNTTGIVALHPPLSAGIVTMGSKTYDYANPIKNSGNGCQLWNGGPTVETANSDLYACNGYQNITFSVNASFNSGAIPAGFWEWKEDGVVKAAFDIANINPPITGTGQLKGFIPTYQIVTDPTNTHKITRVDIAWFFYDGITVTPLLTADLEVLKHFVSGIEAKFDVTYNGSRRTCEMYIDPSVETSFDPLDSRYASTCQADTDPAFRDWYYQDTSHPETNTGLMGFYETGGFGYFFDYR